MRPLLCSILAFPVLALAASSDPPDPFAGLHFLAGEWTATRSGKTDEATSASFTFARDLGGKVLVRRNHAEYAPRSGEKEGVVHDDLMVVYPEAGSLRAVYFDNEGHVIRYAISTGDGRAAFESESGAPGPRFKLEYERREDGSLAIAFSIAPPGKAYRPYLSGTAQRK
jgi:hypothetical protein